MESVVGRILEGAPPRGASLRVVRLDGTVTVDLADLYEQSGRLAVALAELGVGPGDRIGIMAANCVEWVLLDLAALRLKAVTAGLEPGKFAADPALLERYGLSLLFTDQPADGPHIVQIRRVRRLVESVVAGTAPAPVRWEPDEASTIKFTSGSTGEPKGLAATVGSIDSSLNDVQEMFGHGPGDDLFVFLPLSLLQQRYWIYSALRHHHDVTVSVYEAAFYALPRTRPTVVMGVPGFYESAKTHIEATARAARKKAGRPAGPPDEEELRAAACALFGERIRYLWTGSAPAAPPMLRFYTGCELPIYEGYGLNETCIVSKNHPGAWREGSVGQVLPGKKVLLDENGVVSVRPDYPVNIRYEYCAPGDSERIFSPDGTVRTGDLGRIDEDGFLYILGRADDVIVLANGRKVIVRPIEERMRQSPAIGECVVFCPAESVLVAVVSPAGPADPAAIARQLAEANAAGRADERISRVLIADEPFGTANGLLSAQFKPARKAILELYRDRLKDNKEGIHAD